MKLCYTHLKQQQKLQHEHQHSLKYLPIVHVHFFDLHNLGNNNCIFQPRDFKKINKKTKKLRKERKEKKRTKERKRKSENRKEKTQKKKKNPAKIKKKYVYGGLCHSRSPHS